MNNLMLISQCSVYKKNGDTYLNLVYVADDFVITGNFHSFLNLNTFQKSTYVEHLAS